MQPQQNSTTFKVTTHAGRMLTVSVASGEECSASEIQSDLRGDFLVEPVIEPSPQATRDSFTATPIRNALKFVAVWVVVLIVGFFVAMLIDLFIDMAKLGDGLTSERLLVLSRGWLYLLITGVLIFLAPVFLRLKRSL